MTQNKTLIITTTIGVIAVIAIGVTLGITLTNSEKPEPAFFPEDEFSYSAL